MDTQDIRIQEEVEVIDSFTDLTHEERKMPALFLGLPLEPLRGPCWRCSE